jgi:hypothetical protein
MRGRWALLFVLMHNADFSGAATAQILDQRCSAPDPDLGRSKNFTRASNQDQPSMLVLSCPAPA